MSETRPGGYDSDCWQVAGLGLLMCHFQALARAPVELIDLLAIALIRHANIHYCE